MASTSKLLLEWEEKQAVEETMYATKRIQFKGRTTPIILQNENGPCPLLAICNILLLRNKLGLRADVTQVSQGELMTRVAERLFESISKVDNIQIIVDAVDLLPRLATGMDVNVKFTSIDDFEFTRECEIFALLDIPLYHGWIVDPQDSETSNAIGSKSYDTLMGDLVDLQIRNMAAFSMKNSDEQRVDPLEKEYVGEEHEPLIGLKVTETLDPTSTNPDGVLETFETDLDTTSHDDQMNTIELKKRESKDGTEETSSEVVKRTEKSDGDYSGTRIRHHGDWVNFGETTSNEACTSAPNAVESSIEITETKSGSLTSTSYGNEGEVGITARQGELIKDFLTNNASQLTVYGLFCLRDGLEEEQLCVFFRNNHFNTMFKFEGVLYILVTDLGYMYQPAVVWEMLNEVNGDTVFVNRNFKIYTPEIEICTWNEEILRKKNEDYLNRIDNPAAQVSTSSSLKSDLEFFKSLQQHEEYLKSLQQQELKEKQSQRVLPAHFPTSFIVGPEHEYSTRPKNPPRKPSRKIPKRVKEKCSLM